MDKHSHIQRSRSPHLLDLKKHQEHQMTHQAIWNWVVERGFLVFRIRSNHNAFMMRSGGNAQCPRGGWTLRRRRHVCPRPSSAAGAGGRSCSYFCVRAPPPLLLAHSAAEGMWQCPLPFPRLQMLLYIPLLTARDEILIGIVLINYDINDKASNAGPYAA